MTITKCLILVVFSAAALWGAEGWPADRAKAGSPENGKILYTKMRCYYCHKIGGEGGTTGPDLTKEGAKNRGIAWQIKNLRDPSSTQRVKHPENMPKFDKLTEKMFLDLATYLESLR